MWHHFLINWSCCKTLPICFLKTTTKKRKKSHLAGVKPETFDVQGIIHCATQPLRRSCVKLIVFKLFLPMKLCRWTLFKICDAGFDRKSRTLTHFIAFEEHFGGQVSRKTYPSQSLADGCTLQFSGFMRRIMKLQFSNSIKNKEYCQSIEQRNISFQHDISLKTMRKVKNSRESRQNCELGPANGSRRATADLFVMFIGWTSQKASNVHKFLSKSWL